MKNKIKVKTVIGAIVAAIGLCGTVKTLWPAWYDGVVNAVLGRSEPLDIVTDYSGYSVEENIIYAADNLDEGKFHEAENALNEINENEIQDRDLKSAYFYNRGVIHMAMENMSIARSDFEASIRESPRADAYYNLGVIDYEERDFTDAVKNFASALELNECAQYYVGRGTVYEMLGQYQEAFMDFTAAQELEPYNIFAVAGIDRVTP